MSSTVRKLVRRLAGIRVFTLEDGREITYRTDDERRLLEATQKLQIALQESTQREAAAVRS